MKSDRFRLTPRTKAWIMATDVLAFGLIVALVFRFRLGGNIISVLQAPSFWTISGLLIVSLYIFGNYDLDRDESFFPILYRALVTVLVALAGTILLNYLLSSDRAGLFGRGILLGSLFIYYFYSVLLRFFLWRHLKDIREAVRILLITNQQYRGFLEQELKRNKFSGQWHWMLSEGASTADQFLWTEMPRALERSWSAIVIAAPIDQVELAVGRDLLEARFRGVRIIDLSTFYEHTWRKIPVFHLAASWFFLSDGFSLVANRLRLRMKRLMDIILSIILLLLTWPLILLTYFMVKLGSRGPAIYRQIRTGKDGLEFTIFKFRSMRVDAEKSGAQWAQTNDSRVTGVGRFIRLTRLDELPQLWNVFRGDMSFIGPRPERPEFNSELASQIPYYNLRHMVRPGITGWAQVLYPYGASVEDAREKLQYDLFYIKNFSFLLDFQIVLKTISVVLLGKGR